MKLWNDAFAQLLEQQQRVGGVSSHTEWSKSVPDGDKVLGAFRSEVTAIRAGK
jgi:hypothetical protein